MCGRSIGLLAHQDSVQRGCRLETRRRVHDVPGGHRFALTRQSAQRDQRLAGVDRDPDLQAIALLDGPVADGKRRPHGSLGIVLVCDRGAEERHHRVADELLDGPSEAFELRPNAGVEGG